MPGTVAASRSSAASLKRGWGGGWDSGDHRDSNPTHSLGRFTFPVGDQTDRRPLRPNKVQCSQKEDAKNCVGSLSRSQNERLPESEGGAMSSYDGGIMNNGNTRDEDGVDRVPDPPEELKPTLLVFKDKSVAEGRPRA